jgi:hypothetical protein
LASTNPPTFDPKSVVTPEQLFALQRELAELRNVVAQNVDAMPSEPFYECVEPFYSSDDVYYPAGARFVDVTGIMTPNENMIPLNGAAEQRLRAYLDSLPQQQRTPTLANMVEAAMKVRPRQGDDPALMAEMQARMLREAFDIQYGVGGPTEPAQLRQPAQRRANVPLMSNTRILGGDPQRGVARTRFVSEPIAPAHKTTRVMGGVQSNPLGTEQAGVQAR